MIDNVYCFGLSLVFLLWRGEGNREDIQELFDIKGEEERERWSVREEERRERCKHFDSLVNVQNKLSCARSNLR